MIPLLNNNHCKNDYKINFGGLYTVKLNHNAGEISIKSCKSIDAILAAYKEIYNKISLFGEKEFKNIESKMQNIRLLGPEKGIEFFTQDNSRIKINMPDFIKKGNMFNLIIKNSDEAAESIFIKDSKVSDQSYTKFMSQKEIETNKIDEKIQKNLELIDLPFLKLRRFIANDLEVSRIADELAAQKRASEKAQAITNISAPEKPDDKFKNFVFQRRPEVKRQKTYDYVLFDDAYINDINKTSKKVKDTAKKTAQPKNKTKPAENKPLDKKTKPANTFNQSFDYSNSLLTPAAAFEQSENMRKHMISIKKMLNKYPVRTQNTLKNTFTNFEYSHGDSVIKFKNIGADNYKIAFRLGTSKKNEEFYYLAVLDKDDKLIKAFVAAENKIVDASDLSYPIQNFIPERQQLVTPEQQKDFVEYMNITKENLEKYKSHIENNHIPVNTAPKILHYNNSILTPEAAFDKGTTLHKFMTDINGMLKKYSGPTQTDIKNKFKNIEYAHGNSVIKFKNLGTDNFKIAFRLGKNSENQEFYYLAVLDKDDKLLKAFVASQKRIVDASNLDYPVKGFIPRSPVINTPEEQKDFVQYMDILNENLEKYKSYLENKGWHAEKTFKTTDYSKALITPAAAFEQSKNLRQDLIKINDIIKKHPEKIGYGIRKSFPNYESLTGDTVIKFKNLGADNYKIAFRLGISKKNEEFYYLAVFDKNDKLLKAFVTSEKKIVDASDMCYPVKNFIPEKQELATPEQQKDFVKYIKIFSDKLQEYTKYVNYSDAIINPQTAFMRAKQINNNMKSLYEAMDKYSKFVTTQIRNSYPHCELFTLGSNIKLNNLGEENFKIAFKHSSPANRKEFYSMAIFDKNDNLLDVYSFDNDRIIKADNPVYPVYNHILKGKLLTTAEEQKEILKYMQCLDKEINKFKKYVENKGWHKTPPPLET